MNSAANVVGLFRILLFASFIMLHCQALISIRGRAFATKRFSHTKVYSRKLNTGEITSIDFEKISEIGVDFGKFRATGHLEKEMLDDFLNMYKEELINRRTSFPGFRPGKIPPSAMGDIRRYLVLLGLESTLGELCNLNGLTICDEDRNPLNLGIDATYESMILSDSEGRDFAAQRDLWKEGNKFPFSAEFYCSINKQNDSDDKDGGTEE